MLNCYLNSLSVLVFYVFYGYLQEALFQVRGVREDGCFITCIEFAIFSVVCNLKVVITRKNKNSSAYNSVYNQEHYMKLAAIAFFNCGTMGFSNSALTYLNYPTQLMCKSCKLIPVLIGGILIQRKRFSKRDYISVTFMTIGLVWFTSLDREVGFKMNFWGLLYVTIALVFDSASGNYQEKVLHEHKFDRIDVIRYGYGMGAIMLFLFQMARQSFLGSLRIFLTQMPRSGFLLILMSLSGLVGLNFVLKLLSQFGALRTTMVTTLRKAFSISISFMFFEKPFVHEYLYAAVLIFTGVLLPNFKQVLDRKVIFMKQNRKQNVHLV